MKQPSGTPQKKTVKDDVKDPHSKHEFGRDKGTNKVRDLSTSRTTKERPQKEDLRKMSVREKLAVLKSETEKTEISSNVMKLNRIKPRESQSSNRITKETSSKNIKPVTAPSQTPATRDAAPHRTLVSRHTSRSKYKVKVGKIMDYHQC
jgi:hypothetical protein